jgi:hypothetical protein
MQTLRILGIPLVGSKFNSANPPEGNLKGYFELSTDRILRGIQDDRYVGKAVKLGATGLINSKQRFISRIVLCSRRAEDTIRSFKKHLEITKWNVEPTVENAKSIFEYNKNLLDAYFVSSKIPVFEVNYERVLCDPETVFSELASFLAIPPNGVRMKKAIKNVSRS